MACGGMRWHVATYRGISWHAKALAARHSESDEPRELVFVRRRALSSMAKGHLRVIVCTDMLAYGGPPGNDSNRHDRDGRSGHPAPAMTLLPVPRGAAPCATWRCRIVMGAQATPRPR